MRTGALATADVTTRRFEVGELLPDEALGSRSARRIEATAVIIPGRGGLAAYLGALAARAAAFAAWDGRVVVRPDTDAPVHQAVVVDRYGQVYAVHRGAESDLPDAAALEEWFRFLATACPECGVPDEPLGRGWVP